MKNIIFANIASILIGINLISCNKNEVKFSEELWKRDTVSYQDRNSIAKHLIETDTLFNWSQKEIVDKLGENKSLLKEGDIQRLSYKFYQETEDGKQTYERYFDFHFKDSVLIKYYIVEWDTLTKFKRIYLKEMP